MATWSMRDAKANFSRLIKLARSEGPQTITKHGIERAVVLSVMDHARLLRRQPSFDDALLGGPKDDEFASLLEAIVEQRSRDLRHDPDL